jgi:tRNA(Ile)-lysidine synthase
MHELLGRIRSALDGPCRVPPRAHLLVACSGGRDSQVLLHALAELADGYPLGLSAVTVDHGLRPDAAQEIALVEQTCAGLGIRWSVVRVTVPEERVRERGPEAAAREVRHGALRESCAGIGADAVALAHHLQDQAETVLMRALVGTGLRGLGAMEPHNDGLVRPMLDVDVDLLAAYARDRSVAWIEDDTNRDPRFLRNRIRGELMPVVREVFGASGARNLAGLARRASGDHRVLDALAEAELDAAHDERGWVTIAPLRDADPALAARMIHALARRVRPHVSVSQIHTDAAMELLRGDDRQAGVDLPDGLRLERVGEALRAVVDTASAPDCPTQPLPVEGSVRWPVDGIRVRATVHRDRGRVVAGEGAGRARAWFDLDRLTRPLSVRKFAPGTRIRPHGSTGTKRITDLLGEAGIPRRSRPTWPVVTDAAQVIWVPGARAAHVARVSEGTRQILELSLG